MRQRLHVQGSFGVPPEVAQRRTSARVPRLRQDVRREGQHAAPSAQTRPRRGTAAADAAAAAIDGSERDARCQPPDTAGRQSGVGQRRRQPAPDAAVPSGGRGSAQRQRSRHLLTLSIIIIIIVDPFNTRWL